MKAVEKNTRNYLLLGLIGALITVVGELLQGYVASKDTKDAMTALFSTIENLAVWRIGLGSTVGALGILMQFYGYYALYFELEDKEAKLAKIYKMGVYVFTIVGAMVHILMSMLMYVYKISLGIPEQQVMERLLEFTIWFAGPIIIGFFVFYFLMSAAMFLLLFQGKTPYPKWFAWLNPAVGKVFFGALTKLFLPAGSALVNGIGFANMGITSTIILLALILATCDNKGK